MGVGRRGFESDDNVFWQKTFFPGKKRTQSLHRTKNDLTEKQTQKIGDSGALWLNQLFVGAKPNQEQADHFKVMKAGVVVHEIPVQILGEVTLIGRHPEADLQLESAKMGMFHAVILKNDNNLYLESLDRERGVLVNRKKLPPKKRILLYDGIQIDLPGYRLEFSLADAPPSVESIEEGLESLTSYDVPDFFYKAPPPPPSPLLVNLVEDMGRLKIWREGLTRLRIVDIIEETHDCKTFRLGPVDPVLFSYKPGQFITFNLNIDGQEVKRSYSMSSSPSRPHLLEITIKRVPHGLVSNWFCDQVKLGDILTAKGPMGRFTCFDYPSRKMLFVGAGCGITPILSMSRWIADTASDVDVKLLASFKSPKDIIFRKELEMLSERLNSFKVALTITSNGQGADDWTGYTGRINEQLLSMFAPDFRERDIFLCGPEPFAQNVSAILRDLGYDMSRYHTESFGTGRSAQDSSNVGKTLKLEGDLHKVKFTRSGKIVDTDEHVTLLELAEAHGIEIDYSCRIGSCGECEVKCRGEVKLARNCEIDEKTRNAGFVYACSTMAAGDLELDI